MGVGEHGAKCSLGGKKGVTPALHPNLLRALLLAGVTRGGKCSKGGGNPRRDGDLRIPCDPRDDPESTTGWSLDEKSQQTCGFLRGARSQAWGLHRRSDHLICSLADCST